jgi:hypothetical protein
MWMARPPKERVIIGWSALALAVMVGVAVGYALWPASVPLTGTVAIDAVPWATVTRIEAEDGTAQPLPAQATTPLLLTLPEGTYRFTLVGPAPDGESRVATVAVQANGAAVIPTERFRTITPEDYFEQYLTSPSQAPVDALPGGSAPPASGATSAPPQGVSQ